MLEKNLKFALLIFTLLHACLLSVAMISATQYFGFLIFTIVLPYLLMISIYEKLFNYFEIKWLLGVSLISVISIVLSVYSIDFTFDGNAYHLKAIHLLARGHNLWDIDGLENYIKSYGKGSWYVGAMVYNLTGIDNFSKIFTSITSMCAVLLTGKGLHLIIKDPLKLTLNRKILIWSVAFLVVFTPLTSVQLFSNLVDLSAVSALYLGVALFYLVYRGGWNDGYSIIAVYFLSFSAMTKFNMLPISIIFIVLMASYLYNRKKIKIICAAFLLILCILCDPYLINLYRHGNIFYPIFGATGLNSVDPIALVSPWGEHHKDYPEIIRSIQAMFLRYNGNEYKFPGVIYSDELTQLGRESTIGSGYGILSPIIFLFILAIIFFFKTSLFNRLLLGIALFISLQYPGSSFARYAFLYPALPLIVLMYIGLNLKSQKIISAYIFLLLLNIGLSFAAGVGNQIVRQERLAFVLKNPDKIVVGTKYFYPAYLHGSYEVNEKLHGIYLNDGCFTNNLIMYKFSFMRVCAGERIL